MENTLLQNIISNFELMDNQHFLDWFKENKQWMLDQENVALALKYCEGFNRAVNTNEHERN